MEVTYHKKFKKALEKQPERVQGTFFEVLDRFIADPSSHALRDHALRDHALSGRYQGVRSFDVAWDVRVLYCYQDAATVQLLNIGTHAQLYG